MHNTQLVIETGPHPLALPINPTWCLLCHALGCRNRCPLILTLSPFNLSVGPCWLSLRDYLWNTVAKRKMNILLSKTLNIYVWLIGSSDNNEWSSFKKHHCHTKRIAITTQRSAIFPLNWSDLRKKPKCVSRYMFQQLEAQTSQISCLLQI